MKVKIITDSKELKEFTSREDISISKIDIKPCDQNYFAQEWFVASVMYEENASANNFDWQSFRAEATKDILCATLSGGTASGMIGIVPEKETIVKASIEIADELIKQLKEKEEK